MTDANMGAQGAQGAAQAAADKGKKMPTSLEEAGLEAGKLLGTLSAQWIAFAVAFRAFFNVKGQVPVWTQDGGYVSFKDVPKLLKYGWKYGVARGMDATAKSKPKSEEALRMKAAKIASFLDVVGDGKVKALKKDAAQDAKDAVQAAVTLVNERASNAYASLRKADDRAEGRKAVRASREVTDWRKALRDTPTGKLPEKIKDLSDEGFDIPAKVSTATDALLALLK